MWENFQDNRTFIMGDGAPQTLPTVVFNNETPVQPKDLAFTAGTWNPAALGDYVFELTRVDDPMDPGQIVLSSDNEDAVTVPLSVTFDSGSNTVTFLATVVSLTNGDATITASNTTSGAWDTYTVRAPTLAINGPWEVYAAGPVNYVLTRFAGIGNNIALVSSATDVLTVPATVSFGGDSNEVAFAATAVAVGQATITATAANGVKAEFNVTFGAPRLELNGPAAVTAGDSKTYTLTRYGPVGDDVNLASDDPDVMTVPASVSFGYEQDSVTFQATAVAPGTTVLRAGNDDATATPLTVVVAARPGYVMYDDASLYAGGTWTATPAHETGFSDWIVTTSPEMPGSHRGVFIGSSPIAGMDEDGASFGLYANWSGAEPDPLPEIKVSRTFPALAAGQTFAVDVGYNWSSGAKGLKLKGAFEGNAYDRIELFNSGNDTWSYKLDGDDQTITVVWSNYIAGGFVGTVQVTCTAENTYDLSFQRAGEAAFVVANVTLPGSIDTVEFYNWNGGSGTEEDFFFNRMGIIGAGVPTLAFVAGTWNPSALGDYEFTLRRTGSTGNEMIVLQSDNTNSVTVPAVVWFDDEEATVSFNATVVSLTEGDAKIIASNTLSGVWADYVVKPWQPTVGPPIAAITFVAGSDQMKFQVPTGYSLIAVEGADCQLVEGDLIWLTMVEDVDFTYVYPEVTILTDAAARKMIRIRLTPQAIGP